MRKRTDSQSIQSILFIFLIVASLLLGCQPQETAQESSEVVEGTPPNIIIVYADDLGYGDLSSFGAEKIKTPNIDKLASEGKKLTNYYVASPVCSPSRAALLTGSYPMRVGIPRVLAPHGISWAKDKWKLGLNPDESTLPELLKEKGYVTGIFGKWHLGHLQEHLPIHHGFDYFYGTPYSNDMLPTTDPNYPPLAIIENTKIVEENPDQTTFTLGFTEKALSFIDQHPDKPFFVYLAQPMPHVPLYVSEAFQGKSADGVFGDVIEELDASIGRIVEFLEEKKLRENTIVIFTSDNGPWLSYGNHAGSAGGLREGKHTTMEGGQRVPFVMSWPGRVAPAESDALVTNMDLLPTLLTWAGAPLPSKPIDGIAMNDFFEGTVKEAGREEFLYYYGEELQAFRQGTWKLHKPHTYRKIGDEAGMDGVRGKYDEGKIGWALYDLAKDPGEKNDVAERHPRLVQSLSAKMQEADSLLRAGMRKPYIYEGTEPEVGKLWVEQ